MSGFVRASTGSATIGASTVSGTLTPASTEVDLGSTTDRFGTVGVERLAAELVHASQVSVTSVSATQVAGTVVTQGGYALAGHVIQSGSETTAGTGLVTISISSHSFTNYRITGSLASSSSLTAAGVHLYFTTGAGGRASPMHGARIGFGGANEMSALGSNTQESVANILEDTLDIGGVFSVDIIKPSTQFAGATFQSASGVEYARVGGGTAPGDITGLQLLLYSTASTQDSCNLTYTMYGIS